MLVHVPDMCSESEIEGRCEAVHAVHGLPQVSSFLLCL